MFSGNDSYTALEYRFFMTSILRFMLAHFCSEKVSKHYDMSSSRPGEMHAVAYGLKSTQPIKYRVIIVNEYTRSFTRSEQQPQLGYKASDKMNTAWVLRYYVSRFLRKKRFTMAMNWLHFNVAVLFHISNASTLLAHTTLLLHSDRSYNRKAPDSDEYFVSLGITE